MSNIMTMKEINTQTTHKFHKEGIEISKIIWGSSWRIKDEDMESIGESEFAKAKRDYLDSRTKYEGISKSSEKFGTLLADVNKRYLKQLEDDMNEKAKRFTAYVVRLEELIWPGLRVELDNGTSCFVFKASELTVLKKRK